MTAPEVRKAFVLQMGTILAYDAYPLYIGGPLNGRWYMRERMPGTRVWRLEDSESEGFRFTEVKVS